MVKMRNFNLTQDLRVEGTLGKNSSLASLDRYLGNSLVKVYWNIRIVNRRIKNLY